MNPNSHMDFSLIEARPGITVVLLPDAPCYTIVAVSNDFVTTSGRSREEVMGKSHFAIFPENPDDPQSSGVHSLRRSFEYVLQHKTSHSLPLVRYDIPDGKGGFLEKYWKSTNAPVLTREGEVQYIIHTSEDVTTQLKAAQTAEAHAALQTAFGQLENGQKELETAHERIINILESTNDAFYSLDADSNFTYVNQRAAEIWRRDRASLIGKHYWTEFNKAVGSKSYEMHHQVMRERRPVHYETISPLVGIWIEASIYPGVDGGLSVFFRDISERKKAEEALRFSEERLQKVLSIETVGVIYFDLDGSIHDGNEAFLRMSGYSKEDFKNGRIRWDEITPPEFMDVTLKSREEFLTKGQNTPYEKQYLRRDGSRFWGLFAGKCLSDTECVEFVLDITDQKQSTELLEQRVAERTKALEEQKALLDNILTNSSNGISVTEMIRNESGEVIDAWTILANDAAVKFTGLPKDIYLSKKATELDPEILQSPYGQMCLHTLQTGEPSVSQYFLEMTCRWLELTISKMDDDHLIHIFTDVTPIKEAQLQLERSVEELKRTNQNLEEFAYAASHDMKEPIRKIQLFSSRLKEQLGEALSADQRFLFGRLEHASQRMSTLIDDLLVYSQVSRGAVHLEMIDLNEKVQRVLEDLELEIQEKEAIINVGFLPTVKGHRRQLQQLFQNLIGNALKYSKQDTAPVIHISSKEVVGKDVDHDLPPAQADEAFHLIEVLDNGIGFDQADAERIFNVFTRLHGNAEYRGTGVGLSIVQKVVQNHGGYIWAEGRPREGSVFRVLLPC